MINLVELHVEEDVVVTPVDLVPSLDPITVCSVAHTSLNSAALVSSNFQGRVITALIDSGASVSCISAKFLASLAQNIQQSVQPTPEFKAINASGEELHCLGKLSWSLPFQMRNGAPAGISRLLMTNLMIHCMVRTFC